MSKDTTPEINLRQESVKWKGVPVTIEGERVGIRIRQDGVRVPLREVANFASQYHEFYVVTTSDSIYYHQFAPQAGTLSVERSGFASYYGFRPIVIFPPDVVQRQVEATPNLDFVIGERRLKMGGYESNSPIREIIVVSRKVYSAAEMKSLETKCLYPKSGVPARFRREGGNLPPIRLDIQEWLQFYEAMGKAERDPSAQAALTRDILTRHPPDRV